MNTPIFDQMIAERAALRRPEAPPSVPRYAREVLTARPEPAAAPEPEPVAEAASTEKAAPPPDAPESPVERLEAEPPTAVTLLDMVPVRDGMTVDTAPLLVM